MKWRQNTQVIALVHTETPPSCCVSSKLDYKQSLELFSLSVDFNARKRESSQSSLQLKTGTVLSTERIHVHYGWKTNRPFSTSKTVINHFHINGFTPSPTLNRGLWQLGNGPLVFMSSFPDFSIIHLQILQTDLYIFPWRMSLESLIKDQSIFSSAIILSILTPFPLIAFWHC